MTSSPLPDRLIPADSPIVADREPVRLSPIDAVCQAMVDRLKIRLPGKVMVEHFPDKPDQFDFEGYDAAALVIYDGSRFDEEGMLGAQGTRESLRLVVSLLVRELRGPTGAYELLHVIRAALQGTSFAGSTALRPIEAVLEREANNVFQYRLAFEGTIIAVPVKSATVTLPRSFNPT